MSSTSYRIDQFAQIDQLLEKMRQADPAATQNDVEGVVQDVVERDPGKGAFNPALPNVDVARQYRDNLALVNTADPRSLGQRPNGQRVIARVFEERGADMPPGHRAPPGVGVQRGRRHQARKSTEQAPQESWIQYGVPGSMMNDASRAIENLRRKSLNQPTVLGFKPGSDHAQSSDSSPVSPAPEQAFFDATAEKAPAQVTAHGSGPDFTNPSFEYAEGESAYDRWVEKNVPRSQVESGRGREISDDAYGVTVTYHAESPKKNP
ncbi:MAG: hypothetical protein V3T05_13505 [Myxococcota bacterium]